MAIHIETLKTRALTALIFVALMLVGLLWKDWAFIALFTLVHFGCWYEFIKLMKKIKGKAYLPYSALGLAYITLPMLLLIDLRIGLFQTATTLNGQQFGITIPVIILFSIWINDTMAYLVGSVIGKTPFSKISPKKTWEGTAGGAVLCAVAIGLLFPLLAKKYFTPFDHTITYYAIAVICAVFGTAGDLLESKIKRVANVKDSGTFMPGHGGFLDRFDSLLIAVPFVWLYIKLFV